MSLIQTEMLTSLFIKVTFVSLVAITKNCRINSEELRVKYPQNINLPRCENILYKDIGCGNFSTAQPQVLIPPLTISDPPHASPCQIQQHFS